MKSDRFCVSFRALSEEPALGCAVVLYDTEDGLPPGGTPLTLTVEMRELDANIHIESLNLALSKVVPVNAVESLWPWLDPEDPNTGDF